jgi:hypothetical protein
VIWPIARSPAVSWRWCWRATRPAETSGCPTKRTHRRRGASGGIPHRRRRHDAPAGFVGRTRRRGDLRRRAGRTVKRIAQEVQGTLHAAVTALRRDPRTGADPLAYWSSSTCPSGRPTLCSPAACRPAYPGRIQTRQPSIGWWPGTDPYVPASSPPHRVHRRQPKMC